MCSADWAPAKQIATNLRINSRINRGSPQGAEASRPAAVLLAGVEQADPRPLGVGDDQIPFLSPPPNTKIPPFAFSRQEQKVISQEVQSLLDKGAIREANPGQGFMNNIFLVPKSRQRSRLILNLKLLNSYTVSEHFKMEDIRCVKDLLGKGDFMCKLDLKDAYLSIPIHTAHQKYLRFWWKGNRYQYTALPFGLATAPRAFTKVMKLILASLHSRGLRMVGYLDDLLIIEKCKEAAERAFQLSKKQLESLGFVVNMEKSLCKATQRIEYPGFIIDSETITFELPKAKMKEIKQDWRRLLQVQQVSVHQIAHIVGVLAATHIAITPAPLHYRALQRLKNRSLTLHHSYEMKVSLDLESQ